MRSVPVWAVATLQNGYPFDSADFVPSGELPLVRIRDINATDFDTFLPFAVPDAMAVDDGDLVVGMDGDFTCRIWRRGRAALNQRLCRLRAAAGSDIRFVAYSLPAELSRIHATQFATTVKHLSSEEILHSRVPDMSLEQQRRIADFLDDRVARIDRIVAARREQVSLVAELPWTSFGRSLAGVQDVPLRRAIKSLADGPFGSAFSSSDYVDAGPAAIRLGNIGFSEFRGQDIARVPKEIYDRFPQAHVRVGDLLIASLGDANNHAGRACLVPGSLGDAMVKGKCFVARADPSVASERFLAVLLSSPLGAKSLVQQGTGATRSMLNFERLLSCRLPIPSRQVQDALGQAFEDERVSAMRVTADLSRSLDLLTEYKTALITAAVSGEIDVTTAGSGVPV